MPDIILPFLIKKDNILHCLVLSCTILIVVKPDNNLHCHSHNTPALETLEEDDEEKATFSLSRLANTTVFFILNHPLSGMRGSDEGEEVREDSIAVSALE